METKAKRFLITSIQVLGLSTFLLIAASSASTQKLDYRGAAVGAAAGYNGYLYIGNASSESEAKALAKDKGYSYYVWDTKNGNVYAK
ncbi:hypothetical protein [Barnesiella sp. An55]|uniref:hypothetical protein n=1 Tax=Barnesiella sp. An55 TaxID=1965646 RepID=UPI0011784CBE|nr:hypothetical protein [Barnesiella sp. An55]